MNLNIRTAVLSTLLCTTPLCALAGPTPAPVLASFSGNVLTVDINGLAATAVGGEWAGASGFAGFGIKDFGSFTSMSLTSAYGGTSAWTLSSTELNASSASCGPGGGPSVFCMVTSPAMVPTADMKFTFTFTGGTQNFNSAAIKLLFVGENGKKMGDVGYNAMVTSVPEPGTYAMLLAGLGMLGFMSRKRA